MDHTYYRADALTAEANRMMMCGEDRFEMWGLDHPQKIQAMWLRFCDNRTIGMSEPLIAYFNKLIKLATEVHSESATSAQ
jgi:hypothetical protein